MSRLALGTLAAAALVLGACVSIAPAGSAAPPAAVVPSAAPPATNPANPTPGGQGQTSVPQPPPDENPGGNLCDLLSLDEVAAAAGGLPARIADDGDYEGQCTWDVGQSGQFPELPAGDVQIRRDFANAYAEQRELFPNGEDVAVGDEGYWTPELNVLHFLKDGTDYAVQVGISDSEQVDERNLAVEIGALAAPRL